MFFAGPGKGGLQVLFGVAATAGLFWGLHLLGAAGLKAGGAAAGVDPDHRGDRHGLAKAHQDIPPAVADGPFHRRNTCCKGTCLRPNKRPGYPDGCRH